MQLQLDASPRPVVISTVYCRTDRRRPKGQWRANGQEVEEGGRSIRRKIKQKTRGSPYTQ